MRRSLPLFVICAFLVSSCAFEEVKANGDPEAPPSVSPDVVETSSTNSAPKDEALDKDSSSAASIPTASGSNAAGAIRTKYSVIQEGFERAPSLGDVEDFDLLDEPAPKTSCFSTRSSDPNTMTEMVIKQMMVQIEGSPDYGPLFPGSSDHSEVRLIIGKNNGWVTTANLPNEKRRVFEISRNNEALVIKIVVNKFGIYQDIGAPTEVWIKKNANGLIFFKVFKLDSGRKRNEVFIGYCYRKR